MSFIYPLTLQVSRSKPEAALGQNGYSGLQCGTEAVLYKNVPAAIQLKGEAAKPRAGLPQDTTNRTMWRVLIPRSALASGTLLVRDYLQDDLGVRYQVVAPYYNAFGYNLLCERLET